MAEEEQPFLGLDPRPGINHTQGPTGIGKWFYNHLSPKYRIGRIAIMTVLGLAVLSIISRCVCPITN